MDILKKIDQIQDLPTLPPLAAEINRMLQDEEASLEKICRVIEKDQALVPKILRLVNSSFFGFKSRIGDIPRAVVLLGLGTVRSVAMSLSIMDALTSRNLSEIFDMAKFWSHSFAVAATSRHLAARSGSALPDEAFTAGLLHDIGKVLIAIHFQTLMASIAETMKTRNLSFFEAESICASTSHAQIGARLAQKWRLPESMVDTIGRHHEGLRSPLPSALLLTVSSANMIVNRCLTNPDQCRVDGIALHPAATQLFGKELDSVHFWLGRIAEEIESSWGCLKEG